MKNLIIIFLSLITFSAVAQNGSKNFIDQNYIQVSGKAEMEVTPNLIYLNITINESDLKNKTVLSDLESKLFKALKEIGIDTEKDVVVKDISSNFKYYSLIKNDIQISKEYQVLVRDTKLAGRVFVDLQEIGISNVLVEKLDHTDIQKFKKEIKIDAMVAAKEKAEFLAEAINQKAGRAIQIVESPNAHSNRTMNTSNSIRIRGSSSLYGSSAPAAIDIDFEKIRLVYTIDCKFELN